MWIFFYFREMSFVVEMCVKCVIVQGGTHMQQRIEGKDTFSKLYSSGMSYSFFPGFFCLAS